MRLVTLKGSITKAIKTEVKVVIIIVTKDSIKHLFGILDTQTLPRLTYYCNAMQSTFDLVEFSWREKSWNAIVGKKKSQRTFFVHRHEINNYIQEFTALRLGDVSGRWTKFWWNHDFLRLSIGKIRENAVEKNWSTRLLVHKCSLKLLGSCFIRPQTLQ